MLKTPDTLVAERMLIETEQLLAPTPHSRPPETQRRNWEYMESALAQYLIRHPKRDTIESIIGGLRRASPLSKSVGALAEACQYAIRLNVDPINILLGAHALALSGGLERIRTKTDFILIAVGIAQAQRLPGPETQARAITALASTVADFLKYNPAAICLELLIEHTVVQCAVHRRSDPSFGLVLARIQDSHEIVPDSAARGLASALFCGRILTPEVAARTLNHWCAACQPSESRYLHAGEQSPLKNDPNIILWRNLAASVLGTLLPLPSACNAFPIIAEIYYSLSDPSTAFKLLLLSNLLSRRPSSTSPTSPILLHVAELLHALPISSIDGELLESLAVLCFPMRTGLSVQLIHPEIHHRRPPPLTLLLNRISQQSDQSQAEQSQTMLPHLPMPAEELDAVIRARAEIGLTTSWQIAAIITPRAAIEYRRSRSAALRNYPLYQRAALFCMPRIASYSASQRNRYNELLQRSDPLLAVEAAEIAALFHAGINQTIAKAPQSEHARAFYILMRQLEGIPFPEYANLREVQIPDEVRARVSVVRRLVDKFQGFGSAALHARRLPDRAPALLTRFAHAVGTVKYVNARDVGKFPGRGLVLSDVDPKKVLASSDSPLSMYDHQWPWLTDAIRRCDRSTFLFTRGMQAVICGSKRFLIPIPGRNHSVHYTLVVFNDHFLNPGSDVAIAVPTLLLKNKLGQTLIGYNDYVGPSTELPDINNLRLTPSGLREQSAAMGLPVIEVGAPNVAVRGFTGELPLDTVDHFAAATEQLSGAELNKAQEYLHHFRAWQSFQLFHSIGGFGEIQRMAQEVAPSIARTPYYRELSEYEEATRTLVRESLNLMNLLRLIEARYYKGYLDPVSGEFSDEQSDGDADLNIAGTLMLKEAKIRHQLIADGSLSRENAGVLALVNALSESEVPEHPAFFLDPVTLEGYVAPNIKLQFSPDIDDMDDFITWATRVMPIMRPSELIPLFLHRDTYPHLIKE